MQSMKPIQEIRRANLVLLIREAEAITGKERGAASYLSKVSGVPTAQISQFRAGKTHPNGSPRTLGDDQVRKLERTTGKPIGWMDMDHGDAKTVDEAMFLDLLRACSDTQRQTVLAVLKQIAPRLPEHMEKVKEDA